MKSGNPNGIVARLAGPGFRSAWPGTRPQGIHARLTALLAPAVVWLFSAATLAATPQPRIAVNPPAPAPPDSSSVIGSWKGVYSLYPNLMGLELQLTTAPNGAVSGSLKYYPAVQSHSATGAPQHGSFALSGQYDASSRSFLLKPGAWIEKPRMPGPTAPMAGVFDTKANQLAGIFQVPSAPSPSFFVLASAAGGDELIADITRSAYPAPLPSVRGQPQDAMRRERVRTVYQRQLDYFKSTPPPAGKEAQFKKMVKQLQAKLDALPPAPAKPDEWEAPPADKLLDWATRLRKEMPAMDLPNTVMERIWIPARNLFDDVYFKEHFGITYEAMDVAQRKAVADAFIKHGRDIPGSGILARAFQNIAGVAAPDITVSIYWQHVMRAWMTDVQASFPAMPAELNSFTHLASAESTGHAVLPYLWPSEKDKFNAALAETRTKLAAPVLALQADQLIAAATGNAGARELADWRVRQKDILQYAAAADREKVQQRIDARLDELLQQLVAADVSALATLGHGLDAVRAGNRWYQQVAGSYNFAMTRPPIVAALRQFQAVRARDLAEAKPAIIAQLDSAAQEAQVKSILANNLSCPSDQESEVSAAIRKHASQRIAGIQHELLMGLFSAYEKKLMVPPESGHLDLSKADKKHLPELEELRLALLRGMAYGTGKVLDPHTAKVSTLFGVGSMIVKVSDMRNGRYVYNEERGSWMVLYQVDMRFSLPDHDLLWDDPSFRQGAQAACDALNATAALLSQEDNFSEFRLYDDGWGVPDMRQQGANKAGLEAMLRSMAKQR